MSSFDTRNHSALMKRAEQLKRWEESDTHREPPEPKAEKNRKIRFSSGCVFLAACLSGDKDEVVNLLESGADINTANVDGLTALHQACIDDNLEMVEFLVEHGADINRQDNEGWTPLHATASCGFVSIARYLVENGSNLTAVNSDGDLPVDIAHMSPMAEYLQNLVEEHGIDCEKARQLEEQTMLNDAKKWLRSDASEADTPHPKTGATALHVAAAKGYTKVLSLLLAGRANVDKQDNDGWTPLHAAAHWCQKEAAEMLVDAMADMEIRNYSGQTCIDVADRKMIKFLEELKANNKRNKRRPSSQIRISDTIENHIESSTPTKLIRVEVKPEAKTSSNDDKPKLATEASKPTVNETPDEDAPWRRGSSVRTRNQAESPPKTQVPEKDNKQSDSDVILRRTQSFENDEKFYQKYNELRARIKANSCPILPATQTPGVLGTVNTPNQNYTVQRSASLKDHRNFRKPMSPPVSPNAPVSAPNSGPVRRSFVPPVRDEESETQRKAHAKRVRETRRSTQGVTLDEIKSAEELVKKKNLNINNNNNNSNTETQNTQQPATIATALATTTPVTTIAIELPTIVVNDRVPSPTNPPDSSAKCDANQEKSSENSDDITATFTLIAPPKLKETSESDDKKISASYTITTHQHTPAITPSITVDEHKDDDGDNSKYDEQRVTESSAPSLSVSADNAEFAKSDIPTMAETKTVSDKTQTPSDGQSPLHEKRSLFDIDNANSLSLADKLRNEANKYYEEVKSSTEIQTVGLGAKSNDDSSDRESNSAFNRKCDSTPSSPLHHNTAERRPSWRLKFDAGSKFKLEDASSGSTFPPSNSTIISSAPAVIAAANLSSTVAQRRTNNTIITTNPTTGQRPVSAPVISTNAPSGEANDRTKDSASISDTTNALRRNKNGEDKENDKENDSRSPLATQAVIQRRRKPKRRSTGVVHVDMDDIDPDRQDSAGDNEERESGNDRASRSRLGSTTSSIADNEPGDGKNSTTKNSVENGEIIDYKALWEAAKLENDKLKQQLKKKDDDIAAAKATVERFTNATTKNSLSELEKRERRAMERKLSEMEEELKQLEVYKTENQRLKEENGALIRVISKLSK